MVICPHQVDVAPGQRLKYEQYFSNWQENGYDIDIRPFFSKRMQSILYIKGRIPEKMFWVLWGHLRRIATAFTLKRYNAVYVFLWITPFGYPFFERIYCSINPNVIYDIDDAIFIKAKSIVNRSMDFLRGMNKPFFLMRKAKQVITCTPYLTDIARKYNKNVTDISSTINTETYIPANQYHNDHKLVLGWSGSHSTSPFLQLIRETLIELQSQIPFKFIVMGDGEFSMDGIEDLEVIPWSVENEIPTLQRFDIGLYPLPLDSEWVLGKSGLKALQYMAVGVPVVATAMGANYRIMEHGKTGFLVQTKQEWIDAIRTLANDPELRKRVGLAGRDNVEANYSIHANAPVYLNIINSVALTGGNE